MSRRISFRPLIFLVLCLLVVMYLARTMSRQGDITYSAMRENFVQEKVQSFTVSDSRLTATLKDQTTVTCPIRDFTLFYDDLNDLVVEQYSKGIITQYDYPAAPGTNWLQVLLPYVLASRQAVEDMSQKMAVQMEQSIMRAMLPVQRSMDNFILAATQAQVEGVDRIAQVFVQRMNVALGNEFDHLRKVLAETGVEQQKTQQELRAATEAIGQMTQDVVNMHQLSQGVLEHFRAYVADMDASRAQVDDTNRKTIELLEAMGKTSGQQALYLAKLQEYQAALTAASQQYTAWTDRFLASAQEQTRITGKEMDRVVGEMHEGSRTLSGAYEQFTKQTQENLARTTALFDESISSSIHQLNETLDSMRDMTRGMPQLLSQSRDRYAEQVDQFVTALVRLQKAMDKLSQMMDGKE